MENDIIKLEKLLEFYKSETYDSDLKLYMSNEIVATSILEKYLPDLKFKQGYDDSNTHWSYYLIKIFKEKFYDVYRRVLEKMNIVQERTLSSKPLDLIEERTLTAIGMKLLDKDEKNEIGKKLVSLTKHLIEKRNKQVQELMRRINQLKNG
jgi:hypothetical protein